MRQIKKGKQWECKETKFAHRAKVNGFLFDEKKVIFIGRYTAPKYPSSTTHTKICTII